MGKRTAFIFVILMTLISNFSHAGPSQINDDTDFGKPGNVHCKVKFADLDYVGVKFDGVARCVKAKTDKEAVTLCGSRVINPGNPQYQSVIEKGELSYNPDGYYYCVPNLNRNKKEYACRNIARMLSKYVVDNPTIEFTWVQKTKSDGDCLCGTRGSTKKYKCDQEPPPAEKKCEAIGFAEVPWRDYDEQLTEDQKKGYPCKCPDGRYADVTTAKKTCAEPPKATPAEIVAAPPKKVDKPYPTVADNEMKACVKTWTDEALSCKKNAEDAKKNCNPQQSKEDKENAAAIDATRNLYTGTKANTGMQQECFTASLAASGAKSYFGTAKDSCDASVEACTTKCNPETLEALAKACRDKIITDEQYELGSGENSPNAALYVQTETEVRQITENATKLCTEDSKKSQSMLSSLLSGVGDALASSLKCMCQTSSGAADCSTQPTPSRCDGDPTLAECPRYGAIAVCTPGDGYDAKLCSCQLNPKGAGCPGGGLSGGLSNFASPVIKGNGLNDGSGTPTIAGGLKPSGAFPDLPRGSNGDSGSGAKLELSPGNGNPSGGGVGSSGGGGASGGGNGDAAAAPAEAPAEEKGIGGLFNQAKNFFKDALSKKSPANAAFKNPKSPAGMDPNKLRPTRGVASKSGMGSKNQDIWKMSNSCMFAETCPRNMNSFLESPLKQK